MSKREPYLFLFDIFIAILKIKKVSEGYENGEALKHDFMSWDSVIREFEIIGEATKHLINAELFTEKHRAIVDFRNLLIHAYFGIDEEEVWDIIEHHLNDIEQFTKTSILKIEDIKKERLITDMCEENRHHDFILSALKQFK
jgi:uncharacterized protein with HEPN domain